MAGFQKRNWGSNSGTQSQNTPQQGVQYTNSVKGGNNKQFNLQVKFGKYSEKGNLIFKLSGFKYNNINEFNNKFGKVAKIVETVAKNGGKGVLYLVVNPKDIDLLKQELNNMAQYLKSTKEYTDSSVDSFEEVVLETIEKTPTPEEIATNEKNVLSNWKELFKHLQDPETKKKFLLLQTTYTFQSMEGYARAALSPGNVLEVRMADPQASFVTDAATWRKTFNRTVNPGSPYIIITKPESVWPPMDKLNQAAKKYGFNNYFDMSQKNPGLAFGVKKQITVEMGLATSFYKSKVYDVRFTTPIDPNNDPFMKLPQLINNLTGELNQAAKEFEIAKAKENGEETPDFEKKQEGVETSEELVKFKDYILAKCAKEKITIPEVGSVPDIIASAIYAYAYKFAEKQNNLKPETRAPFANAVLFAVASIFNIESSKVGDAVRLLERLPKNELEEIVQNTYQCSKLLATQFSLHESVGGDMSFEEYRNLFNKINPMDSFKNKFNDLNGRMDNLYKD